MTGSVIITGANGFGCPLFRRTPPAGIPDFTAVFTVRDTSDSDVNTKKLREIIARFPKAKASIHKLDLASLESTQAFADTFAAGVASGQYPPIAAIVANAYYWDLVKGPELTGDGFDKTIQINHISHAALVLRLLGSFADGGRVILLSSDSHWPGKNSMEKYPPGLPTDLEELVKPPPVAEGDDLQGRGYQRYATSKLAMTAWAYALNRYLEKQEGGNLKTITAIAMNPGNFPDSRALTRNTPPSLQKLQKYFLRPLLPILKFTAPTLRGSAQGGFDVVELAISPKYAGEKGFYTMLAKDESSPESQDEAKQQSLWAKTLEWARITKDSTALKVAFE